MRHEKWDMRNETLDMGHETCNMKHETWDVRHETWDMRHETWAIRHATRDMRRENGMSDATHRTLRTTHTTRSYAHRIVCSCFREATHTTHHTPHTPHDRILIRSYAHASAKRERVTSPIYLKSVRPFVRSFVRKNRMFSFVFAKSRARVRTCYLRWLVFFTWFL